MQRAKFVDDMVAASDCCVVLSMSAGPLNDLKLQLLYMSYVLLTVHCGDLGEYALQSRDDGG